MPTFTLTTLQGRTYDELDGNTQFYPPAQVTAVLNEGLRRLNLLVGWNTATVSVTGNFTVANQLLYNVPSGIIIPMRVYCEMVELGKVSLRELGERYRTWAIDTTATLGPVKRWAPIDMASFVIHPMDAVGGRLLEVGGVAPVTALVNGGDVVTLPDELTNILVDYARTRCLLKEGGKPFADASMATQQMTKAVKSLVSWEGMKWPNYWLIKQTEKAEGRGSGAV